MGSSANPRRLRDGRLRSLGCYGIKRGSRAAIKAQRGRIRGGEMCFCLSWFSRVSQLETGGGEGGRERGTPARFLPSSADLKWQRRDKVVGERWRVRDRRAPLEAPVLREVQFRCPPPSSTAREGPGQSPSTAASTAVWGYALPGPQIFTLRTGRKAKLPSEWKGLWVHPSLALSTGLPLVSYPPQNGGRRSQVHGVLTLMTSVKMRPIS